MIPTTSGMKEGLTQCDRTASTLSAEPDLPRPFDPDHPPSLDGSWSAPRKEHVDELRMRKRHSFFGRSNSDASSVRRMLTLHSTMSSQGGERHTPPRPATALGETRRRKTEPLESIRNSIFGGRKKSTPSSSQTTSPYESRPPSRNGSTVAPEPSLPRGSFASERDYYRYLRKLSISPPFNFEHVTHTAKKQLPALQTVDEKELTAEFWAVAAYQRPKRRLNGIRADDLSEKLPAMGVERGSPSSRPTSPGPAELPTDRPRYFISMDIPSGLDETMFDEARDTRFDPNDAFQTPRGARQATSPSKRYSSIWALDEERSQYMRQDSPRSYDIISPSESNALSDDTRRPSVDNTEHTAALDVIAKEEDSSSLHRPPVPIDREKQPLPPLPTQAVGIESYRSSLQPSNSAYPSVGSTTSSDGRSSMKSKRSSRSTYKSPTVSNTSTSSEVRRPSILSDATWEDDVDFCYQQEAESTCNFDWQGFVVAPEPSIADSEGGVRLSARLTPSPLSESRSASITNQRPRPSTDTATEPASPDLHRRGSSVGHRGFLAARTRSSEMLRKKSGAPYVLGLAPATTPSSMLSPVFSVTSATEDAPKTPLSPGALHFHGFDSVNRASAEYLSDPESIRTGGSKHSKASSYGSYESIARPAPANPDKARWSMASSSSVPDLLHMKRRSKSSLHKSFISRPLESLPQSPNAADRDVNEESTIIPRASQAEPMRNTFVVRMSQSPRESIVLHSAGRAVQRNRPPTPSRFSRLLDVEEGNQRVKTGAPGWI